MQPTWFVEGEYLLSKLAQLRAAGLEPLYNNVAQVRQAIAQSGLTAYEHFQQYGPAEATAPNQWFNVHEYMAAKANQLNAARVDGRDDWTVADVRLAFDAAGLTAWQHFQQFGWKEGVNPSNRFDVAAYLQAKVAQLKQALPDETWTVERVIQAFEANGYDPVTHFLTHGQDEGVPAVPVAPMARVEDDPRQAGIQVTLSETEHILFQGTPYNDVVIAPSVAALLNEHVVIDAYDTDRDVLKVAVQVDEQLVILFEATTVRGIEVLEVDWRDYTPALVSLEGFEGLQEVHLGISQLGNLGDAMVLGLTDQTLVAGAGVTGDLVVQFGEGGGTVYTGDARSVSLEGLGVGELTVWGGDSLETVDALSCGCGFAFERVTIHAGARTQYVTADAAQYLALTTSSQTEEVIVLSGNMVIDASQVKSGAILAVGSWKADGQAHITLGDDATVVVLPLLLDDTVADLDDLEGEDLSLLTTTVQTLRLDVADGKTATLTAAPERVVMGGDGDVRLVTDSVTLAMAGALQVDKENAGTLTLEVADELVLEANVSRVQADLIRVTTGLLGEVGFGNGQVIEVLASEPSVASLTLFGATAADTSVTLRTASAEYKLLEAGPHLRTLNLHAAHANGLTLTDGVQGVLGAPLSHLVLTGAAAVDLGAVEHIDTVDAWGLAGRLTATLKTDGGSRVLGGQQGSELVFSGKDGNAVFFGQAGDDVLTLDGPGTHRAILSLGDGANSVHSGAVAAGGVLDVQAGAGDDIVTLTGNVSGTLVLRLGGGHNTLRLDGSQVTTTEGVVFEGVSVIEVTGWDNLIQARHLDQLPTVLRGVGGDPEQRVLTIRGQDGVNDVIDLSGWTISASAVARVRLEGLGGDDVLVGAASDDILIGGAGADVLTGGAGKDDFRFGVGDSVSTAANPNGYDRVMDFKSGEDVLRLPKLPESGEDYDLKEATVNGAPRTGSLEDFLIAEQGLARKTTYLLTLNDHQGDLYGKFIFQTYESSPATLIQLAGDSDTPVLTDFIAFPVE